MIGLLRPELFQPQLAMRFVYGIRSGKFIKIGVAMDIAKRLNIIRLSNPHELKVVFRQKMYAAFHCEKRMHEILKQKAVGREWFEVTVEEVRAAATDGAAVARAVWRREYLMQMPDTPATHKMGREVEISDETIASRLNQIP